MSSNAGGQITQDDARRLRAEADAQNARVLHGGREPRDKYYYLIEKAFDRFYQEVEKVDGLRILVAGCSEGPVTALARKGAVVTGIDISEEAIRVVNTAIKAQGLSDRANALVANAEQLEFPDDTFDMIVCTGVLHHLDVDRAAASWARALKPNGRIVMMEPMAWNPAAAIYRVMTPSTHTEDEHPLKPADIRTLKAHFGQVDLESFALTSTLSVLWAVVPDVMSLKLRWRNALDKLDQALMRWFPTLKFLGWSAVIKCSQPVKARNQRTQ